MVIFVQLRKRHLTQRKDPAVSSVKPINRYPRRFAQSGGRRQLTSIQLESDVARWKGQSGVAAQSCNSETASGDQAMKRQCGERQASLKAA